MSVAARRKPRLVLSEIDIQLWARAQRRRWWARTLGEASAKLSRMITRQLPPMPAPPLLAAGPDRAAKQPTG